MSNPAKARGTAWESLVVKAMNAFGIKARRAVQAGIKDVGDIHGISPFVGQCKNYRNIADALREGTKGAENQRVNAGEDYGVAFVKRARSSVGDAYAVMTVETFARVLKRLNRAEALLAARHPTDSDYHRQATAEELAQPFPRGTEKPD